MVDFNTKFQRFLKEKRVILNVLLIFILFCFVSYTFSNTKRAYRNATKNKEELAREKFEKKHRYSEWPNTSIKSILNSIDTKYVHSICLDNKIELKIENLKTVLTEWLKSANEKCIYLYDMLNLIYDIDFHDSRLFMSSQLTKKVKEWLNNDDNLVKQANEQVNLISKLFSFLELKY